MDIMFRTVNYKLKILNSTLPETFMFLTNKVIRLS